MENPLSLIIFYRIQNGNEDCLAIDPQQENYGVRDQIPFHESDFAALIDEDETKR